MRHIIINGIPLNVWPKPRHSAIQDYSEDVEFTEYEEITDDENNKGLSCSKQGKGEE